MPNCGQTSVSVMPLPPDILIVQDRSLSMTDDSNDKACAGGSINGDGMCGAASKWAQTIAAINQVVAQTQAKVNWGPSSSATRRYSAARRRRRSSTSRRATALS